MIDLNIENLSVEEIIQTIKKEVENKRKLMPASSNTFIRKIDKQTNKIQSNNFYDFAKKVAKFLQGKGLSKFVDFVRKKINIPKYIYLYDMADFTKYFDEQFIDNANRLLLNGSLNFKEKNQYLTQLRSGELSKTEIVVLLHYSKKGRKQNIKILGSKKRLVVALAYKIPFIGYISKSLLALITLPRLIKRINQSENNISFKVDKTTLVEVENEINIKLQKIENEIYIKLQKIENEIDIKLQKKENAIEYEMQNIPLSIEIEAIDFFADAISKFPHPVDDFKNFNKDELYYSLFESTFYNHKVVLEKQAVYLQYIPEVNASNCLHLDIGCGRGEFLTLLKQNNYHSMGIDINSLEIEELKKQNFDVEHIDMIDFLQTTKNSFSSISALQVIEHIDYDILKKFVVLAYEKIAKDGVLILETINLHNKVAFNSFYMDETHKRPLPAEMVAFILQYSGFKNIKFRYTSPMPLGLRSKQNDNINYHDYAVIGYKI